jgi:hypothetical protein
LRNFCGPSRQRLVAGVKGDASESDHPHCIQDTADLACDIRGGEPSVKSGGRVGKATHLEQLPPSTRLKQPECPSLSIALSGCDVLDRHLECLVEPVEHRQHVTAPLMGDASAGVIAGIKTGSQRRLDEFERFPEAPVGIRKSGFRKLKNELPVDVVSLLNRDLGFVESNARFLKPTRRHQVPRPGRARA